MPICKDCGYKFKEKNIKICEKCGSANISLENDEFDVDKYKQEMKKFRFKKYISKGETIKILEQFLNALKGKVISIIPIPYRNVPQIELLLIIEEIDE